MSMWMLEAHTCPITHLRPALQSVGTLRVVTHSCSPWADWGCLLAFVVHGDHAPGAMGMLGVPSCPRSPHGCRDDWPSLQPVRML